MIRRPPRSTRTDTLVPYTTLFRSQTAIYRTIGSEGSHRLSFQNWQRAADLGIELPEASAWLYEWRPCTADDRGGAEGARIEAVPMILVPDHDADIEQCAAPLLTEDRLGLRAVRAEDRSEEHTSELQSLMRISYAVFCLKKKIK